MQNDIINQIEPKPEQPVIRLSQCMIVKNEESNIRKALSWGKPVAFEQIVVDTGSTDRTVEIAMEMGAKIYHFDWVEDFSAAKNYAIEQASGNWIAFLDADEFFSPIDAKKLIVFLKRIEMDPETRAKYLGVNCQWVNVDDAGRQIAVYDQERIFRNIASTRYIGRIHERLSLSIENIVKVDEIKIIHTGFTEANVLSSDRVERNISMMRKELADEPDNLNHKAYLADALKAKTDEESRLEAEKLYTEVISGGEHDVNKEHKRKAYTYLIDRHADNPDVALQEDLFRRAMEDFPGDIYFEYSYAVALNKGGEYHDAWALLQSCEAKLVNNFGLTESIHVSVDPTMLSAQMLIAAQGLGDVINVIKTSTFLLSVNKIQKGILIQYIVTLFENDATVDEILGLLSNIYNLQDKSDLLFVARAAKDCSAYDMAQRIIAMAGEME